jgi:hypothetical protein
MNTRKTIYDKLFTEKVELAKHEVELGLIQELESASKNNNDLANKLDKEVTDFFRLKNSIIGMSSKLLSDNNAITVKINKALKATKELGVDSPELFKYSKYASDITLLIKDISNKLK